MNRSDKCEMRRHHSRATLQMIQHGAGKMRHTCEKSVSVRCPRKSTLRMFLSRSYDFCWDGMHSTPALTRSRTTRPESDTSSLAVEMGFYRRPNKVKLPVNQLHWNTFGCSVVAVSIVFKQIFNARFLMEPIKQHFKELIQRKGERGSRQIIFDEGAEFAVQEFLRICRRLWVHTVRVELHNAFRYQRGDVRVERGELRVMLHEPPSQNGMECLCDVVSPVQLVVLAPYHNRKTVHPDVVEVTIHGPETVISLGEVLFELTKRCSDFVVWQQWEHHQVTHPNAERRVCVIPRCQSVF